MPMPRATFSQRRTSPQLSARKDRTPAADLFLHETPGGEQVKENSVPS
jgi:hypothetical protein